MNQQLRILIVDDEQRFVDEIEEFLKSRKFTVFGANHPDRALEIIKSSDIGIAILDIRLPGMSGLDLLLEIKKISPLTEVIMISGHGDMNTVIEAMRKGAVDYFPKPFRLADVYKAIVRTQRFIQLTLELNTVKTCVDILSKKLLENIGVQMIGNSSAMKELTASMNRVAQTPSTSVLILGESGTGKELVAHGIHYLSQRNKNMFYSVNCSAVPESLFESEFFGHKKGAFTGADSDKVGWFEIADKGTLFLDEISDMPLGQQAKLLRVLEERKVSKVGSRQSKKVDVRVVAASNRNLEQLAQENKFRSDLFHRLSIFIIKIPPLRDRIEDIPMLVQYYLKWYSDQLAKSVHKIHPKALAMLSSYDFPGNIRELRNIIERGVIYCDGQELLPEHIHISPGNGKILIHKTDNPYTGGESLDLDVNEKMIILRAMEKAGNNKSKAAALLNITWQALDRRLKKFDLDN